MNGFCIGAAVLLTALDGAARAVYLLNSINKDLTKLRQEAAKYDAVSQKVKLVTGFASSDTKGEKYQAQNAHGHSKTPEQQRLRV